MVLNDGWISFYVCEIVWEMLLVLLRCVIVFIVVFKVFKWVEDLDVFCKFWDGGLSLILFLWFIELLDGIENFSILVLDV